jgi:hypothetical protein
MTGDLIFDLYHVCFNSHIWIGIVKRKRTVPLQPMMP